MLKPWKYLLLVTVILLSLSREAIAVSCGITSNRQWQPNGQEWVHFSADNPLPGETYTWVAVPVSGNPFVLGNAADVTWKNADPGNFRILLRRSGTGGPGDTCQAYAPEAFNNTPNPACTLQLTSSAPILNAGLRTGTRFDLSVLGQSMDSTWALSIDIGDYFEPDSQKYFPYPGGLVIDTFNRFTNKVYTYICTRKFPVGIADDQFDVLSVDSSVAVLPSAIPVHSFSVLKSGSYEARVRISNRSGFQFIRRILGATLRVGMKINSPSSFNTQYLKGSALVMHEVVRYWNGSNTTQTDQTPHWTLGISGLYNDAIHWILPDTLVKGPYLNYAFRSGGMKDIAMAARDTAGFWDTIHFSIFVQEGITVRGRLVHDKAGNCHSDPGDGTIGYAPFYIRPGNYTVYSGQDGSFSFTLPAGIYTIETHPESNLKLTGCYGVPTRNIMSDSSFGDVYFTKLLPKSISVTLTSENGFKARFGEEARYKVVCKNEGDTTEDVKVRLKLDTALKSPSFPIAPSAINTDSALYEWDLHMQDGEVWEMKFNGIAPMYHSVEDVKPMLSWVSAFSNSPEPGLEDNTDTLKQLPVGAIDPNEKTATPASLLQPTDQRIEYVIKFQNTGTAPATNVTVVDTLDPGLNFDRVKILAWSHGLTGQNHSGRTLRFSFDNINLPDSHSNEPASHGYIRYTVDVLKIPDKGAAIRNTAYIYFDMQPPVVTNTTVHVLDTTAVQPDPKPPVDKNTRLLLYPNPVNNLVYADFNGKETGSLQLIDYAGRLIAEQQVDAPGVYSFKVDVLAAGLYLIRLKDTGYYAKVSVIK